MEKTHQLNTHPHSPPPAWNIGVRFPWEVLPSLSWCKLYDVWDAYKIDNIQADFFSLLQEKHIFEVAFLRLHS